MAKKSELENGDQGSDRRQTILAIAAKLFAANGYASTTVRDIADESGILSGSLYHHFVSKEAIAQEILMIFLDKLIGQYEQILTANKQPAESFGDLVRVSFTAVVEQTASVALYQNEALFLQAQPGFEFLRERSARVEEIWQAQLRCGQESGIFRDTLDLARLYRFIRDSMWSSVRWYHPGGRHTVESLSETFLDLMRHGILSD